MTVSETIVIDPRYRGPPHSGNGGYVAGLLAARLDGSGDASFRRPVPLGRELQADWNMSEGTATLCDQGELLVEVQRSAVAIDAPPPPSLAEATEASARHLGRRVATRCTPRPGRRTPHTPTATVRCGPSSCGLRSTAPAGSR